MADPNMSWWDWRTWLYAVCGVIGLILATIVYIPLFILDVILGCIGKLQK
ncbi:MAG: hypothetical protein WDA42_03520 [Candidatus Bathyarchaeia archaeon]